MHNKSSLDILMATYNGASYIGAQIDSLLEQTIQDWQLLIRDDGSQDDTVKIVRRYQARYPDKIALIDDGKSTPGARSNFSRLLTLARADYMMLCDQDDVWFPQKIRLTYDNMKQLEIRFGQDKPLLVHTDAKVVDSKLQTVAQSLWRYQKSDPARGSTLRRLLLQNVATGCSVMINKPLRDMAVPVPKEAMMHDWWLALVAAAFGHIGYVFEPTLFYRQHSSSDIGAKVWNARMAFRLLVDMPDTIRYVGKINHQIQSQAKAFLERYRDSLSDCDREMLDIFSQLSGYSYLKRRYYLVKYRFFYTDLMRNIGRLLFS
jgi:glycosyltransferase involved in cell wall biosynthesis